MLMTLINEHYKSEFILWPSFHNMAMHKFILLVSQPYRLIEVKQRKGWSFLFKKQEYHMQQLRKKNQYIS